MARTLAQLDKQIEDLRRQAAVLREREVKGVIARIREAIAAYGLSAEDLGLATTTKSAGGKGAPKQSSVPRRRKKTTLAKYRDELGNTWSGRGRPPSWFKNAVHDGRSPESLLADNDEP